MQRSGSQKALLVISVISIVVGALGLITGLLSAVGGVGVATLSAADVDPDVKATATAGLALIAVFMIISGAISLIEGILGIRASNDNKKIMPVWILAIISLAFSVINLVYSIFTGSFTFSLIISLVIAALIFWIANNVKQEANL